MRVITTTLPFLSSPSPLLFPLPSPPWPLERYRSWRSRGSIKTPNIRVESCGLPCTGNTVSYLAELPRLVQGILPVTPSVYRFDSSLQKQLLSSLSLDKIGFFPPPPLTRTSPFLSPSKKNFRSGRFEINIGTILIPFPYTSNE